MNNSIKEYPLETLSIELTTKCNLHCPHCFALAGLPQKTVMELEKAQAIAKEGYDIGFRILHLTGGEAFLWKPIFELIEFAFELGYKQIVINTNAHLLDDTICNKLGQANQKGEGKITLTCSINGGKDLHESVRGKDSFEKASSGIRKALAHNINVNIFTTVEKKLIPEIPEFIKMIFKNFPGIDNLFFIQLRNIITEPESIYDQMLSAGDFVMLVRLMGFLRLQGHSIHILENPLANVVANISNMKWFPKSPAITRYGKIVVLSDEKITANHSSRASYGSYVPGKLGNTLRSTEYLRDTDKNNDICPACEFHSACQGNGMLQPSSKDHNNTNDNIPFCKKVLHYLLGNGIMTNIGELAKNH